MSLRGELALASRVMNSWNDRLPADHKLDLISEWERDLAERASTRLAHAPLGPVQ